ncbi:hypothetical protein NPS70_08800 [Streptomyces sp. C10-9-1]|uniref:hypothetical protein n=1 Tax=Streptomyces sp. C10-9-1 TaxID=1859285 RepID=UPI002110F745|nr:hypothetical protein [Streptomyces sp. C10-9-1]MCQ6553290.1 hypothetical protein [Streptomyces sp. C10-9-1]
MTGQSKDIRPEGFEGGGGDPLPRDLPDQQAGAEDPWEPERPEPGAGAPRAGESSEGGGDVPDVDEAGAGPRPAARRPEGGIEDAPEPEEPTD